MNTHHTDRPLNDPARGAASDEPGTKGDEELVRLAQGAREWHIKQARFLLIVVGLILLATNVYQMANLQEGLDSELRRRNVTRARVPAAQLQLVYLISYALYGVGVAVGALFLVFAAQVRRYPVPMTISATVVYVGATLSLAALSPATLTRGAFMKIFFLTVLGSSIKAALAAERAAPRPDH